MEPSIRGKAEEILHEIKGKKRIVTVEILDNPTLAGKSKCDLVAGGSKEPSAKGMIAIRHSEAGKIGWVLLWLLGIPIPLLLVLYFLRGCT